jgi:CRP/FNR family cyclic AMP-dependent transcriptional regulator
MSRPAILDAFASHAFLQRLDDRCLMDLATGARPFAVAAGGYLGRKGMPANAFYLIQHGTVTAGREDADGGFTPFMSVGPGGVVGWSWLVPPHRWHFSCKANDAVSGLMFDAAWLRDRCEQNHELGYHLLREMIATLAGQLVATHEQLAAPQPV